MPAPELFHSARSLRLYTIVLGEEDALNAWRFVEDVRRHLHERFDEGLHHDLVARHVVDLAVEAVDSRN